MHSLWPPRWSPRSACVLKGTGLHTLGTLPLSTRSYFLGLSMFTARVIECVLSVSSCRSKLFLPRVRSQRGAASGLAPARASLNMAARGTSDHHLNSTLSTSRINAARALFSPMPRRKVNIRPTFTAPTPQESSNTAENQSEPLSLFHG